MDAYVGYVEGTCKKPKKPYWNDNKPIVTGRLNGKRGRILLDTGATCNLIDSDFFYKIREAQKIKLQPTKKLVKCANASNMACKGEINLSLSLGGTYETIQFYVVDGLSSVDALLGIRVMKKLGITFSLKKDTAFIDNIALPFEGRILNPTTLPNQGN